MTALLEDIKTSFITKEHLPLVIEPQNPNISFEDFLALLEDRGNDFKQQLLTTGGILFRGFPVDGAKDFETVIKTLKAGDFINYIGGDSPRNKITDHVYTSTEAPPEIPIHLHNEMSFVKNYPGHIYFYCDIPPEHGGETPIADARKIYDAIDPDVRERFINKGLKYIARYYSNSWLMDFINNIKRGHKTWYDVFETHDKQEVERLCRENDFGFKWNKNDWLEICQYRPATIKHPKTGENIWFNQVQLYDMNPRFVGRFNYYGMRLVYMRKHTKYHEVFFGDESPIERQDIYHIIDVLKEHSIPFPWQKGDVLVLDNVLTMHARAAFKGKRRILTAMTR